MHFDFTLLIPLGFFAMIVAIVFISNFFKNKAQADMQATLRAAIEKGQQLTKEDIEVMRGAVAKPPINDIRTGLILLAIGVGFGVFGYMVAMEESDAFYPMVGIGAIPALIGVVFVIFGIIRMNVEKKR